MALLAAGLPLSAQTPTGSWRIECIPTGSTKKTSTAPGGTASGTTNYYFWQPIPVGKALFVDSGWSGSLVGTGTWLIRATWVDANGREGSQATNPPPPQKLVLKVSSTTKWDYSSPSSPSNWYNTFSGDANNGFDDVYQSYADTSFVSAWGQRSGSHVKKLNGSSGLVELTISQSLSANVSVYPGNPSARIALTHGASAALDTREAAIQRVGAHDEWIDANGNPCGDTIFSIPGGTQPGVPSYSRFIPQMIGGWSAYPDPSWPHPNVKVTWDGLDCHYDYSPTYTFDYSNSGVYLQRMNPFPSASASGTLTLKLKDLGDGADAQGVYNLIYHKPGENWRQQTTRQAFQPNTRRDRAGINRAPGQATFSFTNSYQETITKSDEINITGGFNWTIQKDTLAMPVAVGYKRVETNATTSAVSATSSGQWPPNSVRLVVYTDVV